MIMVLLLSQSYEPISIINWKKAISMLFLDKVKNSMDRRPVEITSSPKW